MGKRIIGLCGFKRSGKTAVAERLMVTGVRRMSMAQPIRDMLVAGGVSPEYLTERKEDVIPEYGVTGRHMLQTLGTQWGRNLINADIWVKLMEKKIDLVDDSVIVIDDIRFPNEVEMVYRMRGYMFRINRPTITSNDVHPSELYTPHLKVDAEILNNHDTVEDFATHALQQILDNIY
jgi:hypothetical protein